jgi:hypothetical protein
MKDKNIEKEPLNFKQPFFRQKISRNYQAVKKLYEQDISTPLSRDYYLFLQTRGETYCSHRNHQMATWEDCSDIDYL